MAWLPDTQKMTEHYPHMFISQMQWLAWHKNAWNIQAVMHVGDIVDNGGDDLAQWDTAEEIMAVLDTVNLAYSYSIGNHDYDVDNVDQARTTTLYNALLPQSRYTEKSWWNGGFHHESNSENHYLVLTIGGQDYLFLSLEFGPRQAVVDWANTVITNNPNAKIIVNTHSYLYNDGTLTAAATQHSPHQLYYGTNFDCNDGTELWDELVKLHENIIYVGCGHHVFGATGARLVSQGDNGNIVNQVFCNFQDQANGGNAYLRLMTLRPASNQIDMKTYSPYYNNFLTDDMHQFTLTY